MSLPKFNEFFAPILSILSASGSQKAPALRDLIADRLRIDSEERAQLLPSGKQRMFDNRINWALTYLKKAKLIESPTRGIYQITDIGRSTYHDGGTIDVKYLTQFETFRDFYVPEFSDIGITTQNPITSERENTPQDTIDMAFGLLNKKLADDLLLAIMDKPPVFFEELVVGLLIKMGYGGTFNEAGIIVGKSGDEGIDGIIREDKLGFSNIYIQAKRWDIATVIGRPEIQKFVGALAGQGAQKGLFITTAQFSKDARAYAEKQLTTKVVLVDGVALTKLMIDNEFGVTTIGTYSNKRIDLDFFNDEED